MSGQVTNRLIFWAPRVLGLLCAAFLSIFAFAGFTDGHGVGAGVVHVLTQIIPALVVLVVLAIAWRRQPIGAALFLGLPVAYVATARFRPRDRVVEVATIHPGLTRGGHVARGQSGKASPDARNCGGWVSFPRPPRSCRALALPFPPGQDRGDPGRIGNMPVAVASLLY
jgi:hypothetical protein